MSRTHHCRPWNSGRSVSSSGMAVPCSSSQKKIAGSSPNSQRRWSTDQQVASAQARPPWPGCPPSAVTPGWRRRLVGRGARAARQSRGAALGLRSAPSRLLFSLTGLRPSRADDVTVKASVRARMAARWTGFTAVSPQTTARTGPPAQRSPRLRPVILASGPRRSRLLAVDSCGIVRVRSFGLCVPRRALRRARGVLAGTAHEGAAA